MSDLGVQCFQTAAAFMKTQTPLLLLSRGEDGYLTAVCIHEENPQLVMRKL